MAPNGFDVGQNGAQRAADAAVDVQIAAAERKVHVELVGRVYVQHLCVQVKKKNENCSIAFRNQPVAPWSNPLEKEGEGSSVRSETQSNWIAAFKTKSSESLINDQRDRWGKPFGPDRR